MNFYLKKYIKYLLSNLTLSRLFNLSQFWDLLTITFLSDIGVEENIWENASTPMFLLLIYDMIYYQIIWTKIFEWVDINICWPTKWPLDNFMFLLWLTTLHFLLNYKRRQYWLTYYACLLFEPACSSSARSYITIDRSFATLWLLIGQLDIVLHYS